MEKAEAEVMLLLAHALVQVKGTGANDATTTQSTPLARWLSQQIPSRSDLLGAPCWRHQPEAWKPDLIKAQKRAAAEAASTAAIKKIASMRLTDDQQREAVRAELQEEYQQQVAMHTAMRHATSNNKWLHGVCMTESHLLFDD